MERSLEGGAAAWHRCEKRARQRTVEDEAWKRRREEFQRARDAKEKTAASALFSLPPPLTRAPYAYAQRKEGSKTAHSLAREMVEYERASERARLFLC